MTRAARKEFLIFLCFLGGLLALFFWPILFRDKGFVYGDYRLQFYPWAKVLSEHIKRFSLPLWTPEIGCGFPLLAEGQSAMLYPLNWILFFFLPFPFSYHFGFVFSFFLAGLFTYWFSRAIGISLSGACLATLVYLFGSAYAGLAYGVMSLRVMIWLPLGLLSIERLCQFAEAKDVVLLAIAWAWAFLAGYPQLACYSVLMGVLYFLLRLAAIPMKAPLRAAFFMLLALLFTAGLSACQLLPTLELAGQSSRASASLEFALQKSFNPLNLATLLWPGYEKFFGFGFYAGILPLCLALLALCLVRKNRYTLIFSLLTLFFVLLSFGGFNPLYTFFVKMTHFYFFRVPSKFIFLAAFSVAVLAGIGLDLLLDHSEAANRLFLKLVKGIFFAAAGIQLIAFLAARLFKQTILAWGEGYVQRMIYGKAGHVGTLESYRDRLNALYQAILERTRFTDPHVIGLLLIWAVFFLILYWKRERFFEKKNLIFFMILLTAVDLFSFSFFSTGFRGNQRGLETTTQNDTIRFLLSKEAPFRTYEMVTDPSGSTPNWLPNSNMIFGISSVGIYTPLAIGQYRDLLKDLGAVDNASGSLPASKEAVIKNLKLLGLMNVRFIVTRKDFENVRGLRLAFVSEQGDRIYENLDYLPRAFLTRAVERSEKNKARVLLEENMLAENQVVRWEEYTPTKLRLKVTAVSPAFLFLSELNYPGWQLLLDGAPAKIYRTNEVFRGADVPSGSHELEFFFKSQSFRLGCWVSAVTLLLLVLTWVVGIL